MEESPLIRELRSELLDCRARLSRALEEKQMLERTTRHLAALQTALDAIFFTDEYNNLIFVNQALLHLLGYSETERDQLLGAPLPLARWSNRQEPQTFQQELEQHGWVENRIVRLLTINGTPVLATLSAVANRDAQGRFTGGQYRLRPLSTAARRGTAELRAENRQLTALTALSSSVLSTMNPSEVLAHLLKTVRDLFDVQAAWVFLRTKQGVLELASHDGLQEREIQRIQAAGIAFFPFRQVMETRLPHLYNYASPTSERLLIAQRLGVDNLAIVPLLAHEQTVGLLVIASLAGRLLVDADLRLLERVAQYAGLAISNATLYDDLQQAYQELTLAQERLVEVERQKVAIELAGATAHELNQPLTVLMGYTSLLARSFPPESAHRPMVDRILENAQRISEVVKQLGHITLYRTRDYGEGPPITDLEGSSRAPGNAEPELSH